MINLVGKEVHFVHNSVDYRYTKIGEFVLDVDGYYKFFPEPYNGGCWDLSTLAFIVEAGEEMNKEWDAIVQTECSG